MRIIKPLAVKDYWRKHPDAEPWLKGWMVVVRAANWHSVNDVRGTYKDADAVKVASGSTVTVFNVKGNRYRLVVAIHYNSQCIYVRYFMTHAEYNNQLWKNRH